MPELTITFENDINISAQVGDTVYWCAPTVSSGFNTSDQTSTTNDNMFEVGPISGINNTLNTITCNASNVSSTTRPPIGSFILFSKDNSVNISSPIGYYAQVKFKNDSTVKGEMFSAACEVFESSK
jgi:hypothetical protein